MVRFACSTGFRVSVEKDRRTAEEERMGLRRSFSRSLETEALLEAIMAAIIVTYGR